MVSIGILAAGSLSAITGSQPGDDSHRPTKGPPAGRSPSVIKTSSATLPDGITNARDMPAFRLQGLDGKTHRLDEWQGKVIMLNFWATWCTPCRYEIGDFAKYQKLYGSRGLQIVGVGLDKERKLRNVVRSLGIDYPTLIADPAKNPALLAQWGNPTQIFPYTVVIDRDGRVKYIHRGQMHEDVFDEFVLPLLSSAGRSGSEE